jgi:hypothetical protein
MTFDILSSTLRQALVMDGGRDNSGINEYNARFLAELIAEGWAYEDPRGIWLTQKGMAGLMNSIEDDRQRDLEVKKW